MKSRKSRSTAKQKKNKSRSNWVKKTRKVHKDKPKQRKTEKYTKIQMGGKTGPNDNNANNNASNFAGFFNPVTSAFETIKSALPEEITGESEENKNQTVNPEEKEMTISELLVLAESRKPGEFKTYNGLNPFIIENESESESKKSCVNKKS